jgi:outer membrane protein OmpA-like peptidoglycan-associated protein
MYRKVLIGAVVLALSSAAANAGENKLTREEGTGMFGGAAIGAVFGGPVGAAVGLMLGGVLGDSIGTAKRADLRAQQWQEELSDARTALAKASEQSNGNEVLDALAERLNADVMFRTASADIDEPVAGKLAELGKLLSAHATMEVQLHGFADPRGTPAENLELSLRRADAVREALIKGGASPEQIRLSAHGEDMTTAAKDDLEAFAWERRVSLAIRPAGPTAVAQAH